MNLLSRVLVILVVMSLVSSCSETDEIIDDSDDISEVTVLIDGVAEHFKEIHFEDGNDAEVSISVESWESMNLTEFLLEINTQTADFKWIKLKATANTFIDNIEDIMNVDLAIEEFRMQYNMHVSDFDEQYYNAKQYWYKKDLDYDNETHYVEEEGYVPNPQAEGNVDKLESLSQEFDINDEAIKGAIGFTMEANGQTHDFSTNFSSNSVWFSSIEEAPPAIIVEPTPDDSDSSSDDPDSGDSGGEGLTATGIYALCTTFNSGRHTKANDVGCHQYFSRGDEWCADSAGSICATPENSGPMGRRFSLCEKLGNSLGLNMDEYQSGHGTFDTLDRCLNTCRAYTESHETCHGLLAQ
jgi:hypothetical protein